MRRKFSAVTVVIALVVAAAIPASPAQADSFRDDQWYLKMLKISQAHAISKGAGITVAVIDTGSYPHPDLKRNLLPGIDEVGGGDNGHDDEDGHGTQMAAIIAAHGRGNDGVLGIAPAAKILPIKVGQKGVRMSASATVKGVEWAVNKGAQVINASFSSGLSINLENTVMSAIDNNDIVFVAGVGNSDQEVIIGDPAKIDGVLAVGAVDRRGRVATFSIHDPKVEICAPGVEITTAQPKEKYVDGDGTSEATAIVSGAAALVRSKFPKLSAKDVIHRLTATADDIGPPGRDDECGFGVLNIVKALTADVPPLGGATASATATAGSTITAPTTVPTTGAQQAEDTGSTGSRTPVIVGAVVVGLVVAGVLVFLSQRRRRTF